MANLVKQGQNKKKRQLHPNSLANLQPNRQGRPKRELCLTDIARDKLNEPCPYDPQKRPWKIYLVERWFGHAAENAQYFRELLERLEGKIMQPLGNEDGSPLSIQIKVNANSTKEAIGDVIGRLSAN